MVDDELGSETLYSSCGEILLIPIAVGTFSETLNPDVEVLHFWHALEKLMVAAEAAFGSDEKARKKWFKAKRHILRHDPKGVDKVMDALRYLLRKGRGSAEIRKVLGYFRNNRSRMNYYHLAEEGYPIGSGEVEAANKMLVTHRLKRSGQRWGRDGGQGVLDQRHRCWVQRHRSATSKDQRHRSATLKLEATSQSANHPSQHNKNLIYGLRKAPSKPSSSFGASMSRIFTSTVALQVLAFRALLKSDRLDRAWAMVVPRMKRSKKTGIHPKLQQMIIGRSSMLRDSLIASTLANVSIGDKMCHKKSTHMGITPA